MRRRRNRTWKWVRILIVVWLVLVVLSAIVNTMMSFRGLLFPLLMLAAIAFVIERMAPGTLGTLGQSVRHSLAALQQSSGADFRSDADKMKNASANAVDDLFQRTAPPEAVQMRRVAVQAMKRAGYPSEGSMLRVTDLGLLVYKSADSQPKISRAADVPTDSSHVRPFIVVDLNRADLPGDSVPGTFRFNLVDESGALRYTSRARYDIRMGQNFITPKTWLPLTDQNPGGKWTLQVALGDNQALAVHDFEWLAVGGARRATFTGDGEISDQMRSLMPTGRLELAEEPVSLDELMSDQDEGASLQMHGS